VAAVAVAKEFVAGAEQKLATGLRQEVVANAFFNCGEPYLTKEPNVSHSMYGEPNISCGDVWQVTKHSLMLLLRNTSL
jgi:hypothetical protein